MKKWLYFIAPVIMLVIFTFFYFAHAEEVAQLEIIREEKIAKELKTEADRKARIEEEARIDADRRAAERRAKIEKKEAARVAKWTEEGRKIEEATQEHRAAADKYAAGIAKLEIELDRLHKAKEKISAEELSLALSVERARIAKRSAELEIQRKTELMLRRAANSSATRTPPPPLIVKKRR